MFTKDNALGHHRNIEKVYDEERLALLALHCIAGIGGVLIRQLISYCGSAAKVFETDKRRLLKIPNIGKILAQAITTADPFEKAEEELEAAEKKDVRILFFNDADFPRRLKELDNSPSILYAKGNIDLNALKTVGIVGTRKATRYGKEVVEKLVEELVDHQPLIVSGLAYGIDIHAHKQALKHDLPTLGVMGSGMDVIYPSLHRETAEKMMMNGGLITENPLGTSPEAHHFPARNRIIAGLCDALIVVETAERGGAVITTKFANNYGKDVFAIPGSIGLPYSAGCNKLIKTHQAHLLTTINDLEYIMRWDKEQTAEKNITQLSLGFFNSDEQKVITLLKEKEGAMTIDELSSHLSFAPSNLASILLNLEFKNAIRSMPGKNYVLDIHPV